MTDIMLVGEAWGKQEEEEGRPFVGASGFYLDQMLSQVGIRRSDCYVTNVFNVRPQPSNDVENLCGPKAMGISWMPPLKAGKYVSAEYEPELKRLYREIATHSPNVIVAFGATAGWALLRTSGIKRVRGAPALAHPDTRKLVASPTWQGKIIPTYHPAAMMRDMSLRPIILSDLDKTARNASFPEIIKPHREFYVEPTYQDLLDFERAYIEDAPRLSVDIETKGRHITCIGFAPSRDRALVVPFWNPAQADGNYWRTFEEERLVWSWVKRNLQRRNVVYIGQNFMYDMTVLLRQYGITVDAREHEDTMLLHHALQPEMEKGLGFLATLYTDEPQWKFMRTKHETAKKEDT